ncbi:MAG: hypothetical protein PVI26_05900 [Chitinispirillia bacterium]|jgi:hypothetical protein
MYFTLEQFITAVLATCSMFFSFGVLIHGLISMLLGRVNSCTSPTKSRQHYTKGIIRLFPIIIFYILNIFIGDKTVPYEAIKFIACGVLSVIAYLISFFIKEKPKTKNYYNL